MSSISLKKNQFQIAIGMSEAEIISLPDGNELIVRAVGIDLLIDSPIKLYVTEASIHDAINSAGNEESNIKKFHPFMQTKEKLKNGNISIGMELAIDSHKFGQGFEDKLVFH